MGWSLALAFLASLAVLLCCFWRRDPPATLTESDESSHETHRRYNTRAAARRRTEEWEAAEYRSSPSQAVGRRRSGPGGPALTWAAVMEAEGKPVRGVLELRARGPAHFHLSRALVRAEDSTHEVGLLAFYLDGPQPPGLSRLAPGSRIRLYNPRFHWFLDGQWGARIEDDALPYVEFG
eukprot:tig00020603_g11739.t1